MIAPHAARPVIVALMDADNRGGVALDVCGSRSDAERAARHARAAYGPSSDEAARVVLSYPAAPRAVWGVAYPLYSGGHAIDWHDSKDEATRAAARFAPGVATVCRFSDGRWRAVQD